jgi:hypothetical protein
MATAGLPFANPFMDKMNLGEAPNPYAPFSPTSSIGLGGLAPSAADMAVTGQALVKQTQFTMPEMKQPPSIAFSPTSKQLFINGITFDADDATKALQSEQFLKGPGTGLPQGGDWVPLDEQAYGQYLQSIRNPSLGRLASKSFGRGIDAMQALGGRALQLAGAEETGGRIVEQQEADLAKTAPYERQFTDIESGRGAVEWLVANFAQQGPNLIESVLTTGAGFLAGTATGGPLAGVGGALAGMMGKTAFKEAVIAAAAKKAAGTTLSAVENKLLREAAGIAGAVTTSYAQNLATGAADIYGELREQGAGADDTSARLKALAGSIPYAALETLPEYLLASRVFGGAGGRAALPKGTTTTTKGAAGTTTVTTEPSRLARGAELLRRGAVGGAVGGTLEGGTELGQEGLLLGISGQDLTSPESVNRLINSFAAGFGVGGPIGAVANLRSKQPENLLAPGQKSEPTKGRDLMVPGAPSGTGIEPYYTPVNFMGREGGGPIYTGVGAAQKPTFPAVGAPPNQPPLLPAPPPGTAVEPYYTDVTFAGRSGGGPIYPEVGGTSAPPTPQLGAPPAPPAPPTPQLGGPLALGAPPTPPLLGGPTELGTPQQLGVPTTPLLGGPTQPGALGAPTTPLDATGALGTTDTFTDGKGKPRKPRAPKAAGLKKGKKGAAVAEASVMAPLQYPDGSTYTGETADGQPNGQGVYTFPDGSVYTGQLKSAKDGSVVFDGQGRFVDADGTVMEGTFKGNDFQGTPKAPAAKKAAPTSSKSRTPFENFDQTYARNGSQDMRVNPDLIGVSDYADWLGSLTPEQKKTIAPSFTQEDNPFLNAVGVNPVAAKAKFEKLLGITKAPAPKAASLKKGKKDAIQEPSTAKVSSRKSTKLSKGVGAEVPAKKTPARKGAALKTKGKGAVVADVDQNKSNFLEASLKRGELAQAGRQWSQYADPKAQPKWKDLSPEQQEKWRQAVADGKPTIAAAEEIAPSKQEAPAAKKSDAVSTTEVSPKTEAELEAEAAASKVTQKMDEELSPAELLTQEIQTANETTDIVTFKDAIQNVMYYANFAGEDTNIKKMVSQAQAFLANTEFSDAQMNAMDEAFLELAQFQTQLEARYKGGARKGENKPWFGYAVSRNLLGSIKARITNMPEEYKKQTNPVTGETTKNAAPTSADTMSHTPEALLGELIADLISRVREYSKLTQPANFYGQSYANVVELAKQLYARTTDVEKNFIVRGSKLSDYFKADGSPKMLKSGGRYIITTSEVSTADQRAIEKAQREEAKALAAEDAALQQAEFERAKMEKEGFKVEDEWDSSNDEDGSFFRADGTPDSKTIAPGRVRLLVNNFLNKLRVKPSVTIYANVADLKKRNPDLYRRAAAARKEGDFDTTNAAGYSFGPNVIIFTDFVRTEQQLKFVLAHETLGHFGFKGVIPKAKLDEVLNKIYDLDPGVQAAVEAMMSTRGMSKLEAIEEYLADNAAELDTSLITRMWNVLKNFLNKLGFEFQDDEARYFVNLARKYVRQDDAGNFVNARSIMGGLESIGQDEADGRYARIFAGDMGDKLVSVGSSNRNRGNTSGFLDAVNAFAKNAFGKRRDVPGTVSRILESVQTLSNKARRSYGLSEVFRMITDQQQKARAYLSKYERMTRFTHSAKVFGYGKGVTEPEKETAGELLANAALLRADAVTPAMLRSFGPLVIVDAMGNITIDEKVRDKLEAAGFVTAEEFRKGFDVTFTDGSKSRFQYDVDDSFTLADDGTKIYTDPVWRVYVESRKVSNEAAIDMMLANYESAVVETKRAITGLNNKRSGTNVFTEDDLDAIRKAADLYRDMNFAGSTVVGSATDMNKASKKKAEEFVIAFGRALFDDKVAAIWLKDPSVDQTTDMFKDLSEFQKAEYDDLRAALPSLRAKFKGDENARKQQSFAAQKAVRDSFLFSVMRKDAELYAKNSILGSYVRFARRGTEQVRLTAVDAKGNPVTLDENVRSALPYFIFESRNEALESAKLLDAAFGNDNEFVMLDEDGNETTVKLIAEVSRVRQTPDLTASVNFNEFIYLLNRLNVNLAPDAREKIVTTLTNQNARARKNLQRSGTPGWDKDIIRSLAEHLQATAHVAAKKLYSHRLDDVMLNKDNWLGDDDRIRNLKKAVDNAQTDGERARAQRAYDEYAYMYRYMKATSAGKTVTIDGKEVPTLGRGEDYRRDAQELIEWLSDTTNISDSTEDMLSGKAGSMLKLATVLMQLGGSVASAVVNLASTVTNTIPYLSFYNPKNGFGGGYGVTKSATGLWKAAGDIKNPKFGDAAFLDQLLRDGSYERYGLTEAETEFLLKQTEQGFLDASQYNALVGTASGKVFSNRAQAGVQAWMSMFAYTEQLNRRTSALATFRLEAERLRAQGVVDENQIAKEATDAARRAVVRSQGEYAMFNRPEMARGNVLQYVFMYKQFVIMTVELLKAMPPKGQLLMLGMLLLASGLKGLPFAEDIFDIVDTIAQKLGLKMGSIEKEIAEWVDSVAPGMTPFVMRGVLDRMTGATVSTRLGMGNLIPLTGAFKAGADPAREVADFAGPVFSGISGLVGLAGNFAKYGAETIGLRDDVTTISGIFRDSPIAAARAIADGLAYMDSGMITNNRGQVVSREAPGHVIVARLLGFYPAIATEQNDIVRISKDVANYAKAIKADYVSAYVKAKLDNDTDRMQKITEDVRQWNEDAKGTGLEVSKFASSANRAALEASRPTVARYLKSAPKQMRPETIELLRINGLEDEVR